MNPKNYQIRVNPLDGALWLVTVQSGVVRRIRDMSDELLLALCADLGEANAVERFVKFSDGSTCKITVEITDA